MLKNLEKMEKRMTACRELMNELVPDGAERPLWDARTGGGNVSLAVYNRWVGLSNCLHLWEAALNSHLKDNQDDAAYCAAWPGKVYPDLIREIKAKAGL